MSPSRPLLLLPLVLVLAVAAWILAGASSHATAPSDVVAQIGAIAEACGGGEAPGAGPLAVAGERNEAGGAAVAAAARAARVKFIVSGTATASAAWNGSTLTAEAQGEILARAEGEGLAFEVPTSASTVKFSAVGYRSVSRDVPATGEGPIDFGTIALEPDAVLVVRVNSSAAAPPDAIDYSIHSDDSDSTVLAAARAAETIELPVPSDTELGLFVRVDRADGPPLHLAPVPLLLQSGERREVELSCDRLTTARLVGMSPGLLEHAHVSVEVADPERRNHLPLLLRPDASGRVCFTIAGAACRARIRSFEGDDVVLVDAEGAVDLPLGGGEVTLSPAEPVIAFIVLQSGRAVPSQLPSLSTRFPHPVAVGHVLARKFANERLETVWVESLGDLAIDIERLQREDDIWLFDADGASRLGWLSASCGEDECMRVRCVAEPVGGGPGTELIDLARGLNDLLPIGEYRLCWVFADNESRVACGHVRIVAGKVTDAKLSPPPVEEWSARLRTPSSFSGTNMLFVSMLGSESRRANDAGAWVLDLPRAPRIGDRCSLTLHPNVAAFPASVVAVDPATRHFDLDSPMSSAAWTRLEVTRTPDSWGVPSIVLSDGPSLTTTVSGDSLTVPLLPGTSRDGCLVENIQQAAEVTRWFRIEHGVPALTLSAQGHWCPIRFECPFDMAKISARGPGTLGLIEVRTVHTQGDSHLFVADGTTEIVIDLTPGGRRTLPANVDTFVVR